jgi:predicted DNA-binding transcriptional regulator AlpA
MRPAKADQPQMLVSLTTDQLAELLEQASARALAAVVSKQQAEVLDLRDCAALLKCTTKTVAKYVQTRALPCHYISSTEPRFRRSEVLAWLTEQGAARVTKEAS